MSARFILAQISDTHIRAPNREPARDDGFNPSANLERALAAIADMRPDAIIATGDLVNDSKSEEYAELARLLRAPPASLYLVPGNHDDAGLIRQHFSQHLYLGADPLSYVIDDHPLRLVIVDQTLAGAVHGLFTETHARWLDHALAAAPDKPTIVALHHPPFATHDRSLDTIGLHEAEGFRAVIARHSQVLRIICGHNHRAALGQVAHAPAFIAPSTTWSFSLALHDDQPAARRSQVGIGWALHVWTPQAGLASHVMPL